MPPTNCFFKEKTNSHTCTPLGFAIVWVCVFVKVCEFFKKERILDMPEKVKVTERALFARLARVLKKDGTLLKRLPQRSKWWHDLGTFYTVDANLNCVVDKDINLEVWSRELGVLKEWEVLADDE